MSPPISVSHKTNIWIACNFKIGLLKKSALINIYLYLQRNTEDPLYLNIGRSPQRIPTPYVNSAIDILVSHSQAY